MTKASSPKAQEEESERDPLAVAAGKRIKLVRLFMKLTQEVIAPRIGTAQSQWSEYESGKTVLPPRVAVALCENKMIAKETGVNLAWLYQGETNRLSHQFVKWLKRHR